MKRTLAAGLLVGALLAAVAFAGVFSPAGARGAPAAAPAGTVTTTGNRASTVVPDRASFAFGVTSNAATAAAALSASADAANRVIGALQKAGVAKADIQTSDVSLSPRTNQAGDKILGYSASVSVTAIARSIKSAGAVVDAAVGAGANEVSGPNLLVSDQDAAYRAALKNAVADARAKAQTLAAAAGITLGAVVAVTEGSQQVTPIVAGAAKEPSAAPPIEPGTQEIDATVTVTFATG